MTRILDLLIASLVLAISAPVFVIITIEFRWGQGAQAYIAGAV